MKIAIIFFLVILSRPAATTTVTCHTQSGLNGDVNEQMLPTSYQVLCGESTVAGKVSAYAAPETVVVLLNPSGRRVTITPTCGNARCNLQQINRRTFDPEVYAQIRRANGGQSWTNLQIQDVSFSDAERLPYLLPGRGDRPSSTNLATALTDENVSRLTPARASENESEVFSACRFTNPATGDDVPPRIISTGQRDSCGAPAQKLCRGTARCYSLQAGRRITGEGFCRALPDGSCPGADACINSTDITEDELNAAERAQRTNRNSGVEL